MTSPKMIGKTNRLLDLHTSRSLFEKNWSILKIDDSPHLFKCDFKEDSYEILLFDKDQFKLLYSKETEDEILDLFKKLNSVLEAPLSKILAHLKECLLEQENCDAKLNLDTKNSTKNISLFKLHSKLVGIKFNWEFKFIQMDPKSIRDYLVLPLLYNCAEYQQRENELVKIILAKDKEIDDYKAQGTKLSRKYLSTDVFSMDNFDTTMAKKSEINDILENPEKCLQTELANTINASCISKYFSKFEASPNKSQSEVKKTEKIEEAASSQEESSEASQSQSQSQKSNDSRKQELSRKEELKLKLKEEEEKKMAKKVQQKKKKLF